MIQVLFFASIRERLGCDSLELAVEEAGADLNTLQALLEERGGELWCEVLGQDNIIRAVNQAVVEDNAPIGDGDEVAFFPPVTGG